mgnify:CR=1 FL=1
MISYDRIRYDTHASPGIQILLFMLASVLERRNLNIQMLLHGVCVALYLYQVCAGEHKLGEAHFTRTPLRYREPQLIEQENCKATQKVL